VEGFTGGPEPLIIATKISTKWSGTPSTHGHVQASTSTSRQNFPLNKIPFYF